MIRYIIWTFFFSCTALAQGNVVTGEFKREYRTINLYDNIRRALFVLEEGNAYLLEDSADFLKLSPLDAKRLGTSHILLIPLFGDKITYKYDIPISFEILPIPNAPDVYYTKKAFYTDEQGNKITLSYPEELPLSTMEKIKKGIPIYYQEINNSDDFRDIPQWIEALSSTQKVTIINQKNWEGVSKDGKRVGGSKEYKQERLMSELAQERLSYIRDFLSSIVPLPEKPTQEDWRKWWQRFQKQPYPMLQNLPVHIENFEKDIVDYRLYALDKDTQKVYSLHQNSSHGKEQLLVFDTQNDKVVHGRIYSKEQPDATDFETFYAQRDTLYTLNSHFVWAKYVPKRVNDSLFYQQIASADVVPEPNKSYRKASYRDIKYHIVQTYTTAECMYSLVQKIDTKEFQVMTLNTKTGKIEGKIPLNPLLDNPKQLEHRRQYIATGATDNFVFQLKTEKGVYFLRCNATKLLEKTLLGKEFEWGTTYLSWGKKQYYGDMDANDTFNFYTIATPSKEHRVSSPDDIYDTRIMEQDEDAIVAFYEYYDGFFSGLKMQRLDKDTQALKGESILLYQYFPVEEMSSENTPSCLKAFKINGQWHVFFTKEDEYFWVKVK
ncbi:hypothetical protein HMPREF1551_00342 [Capnocytophaga sp. oral taxon 863 str. F0517]|uniref:hypothetical protein n=1 Tax=Capnocytophaga sp. oral taxon 863 TaxID=1227265 RepID=UPI00039606B5|nr:hypothetical protein [Capnocytophaga sp. oral taxon 863]ERI64521.1 hypothetical protein HMPREF1551_00342 [Capnocytophaga sp. oral taxon 863 str. F0517]